tara:strand:+ start:2638 stop:2964 length:327 start_codon:yes stop_codon:yes gene_type:complete
VDKAGPARPAHGVRFAVEAPDGFIGGNPEEAVRALSRLAAMEGADPELWLLKAAGDIVRVRVGGKPRFAVIPEFTEQADRVFRIAMGAALEEIVALLEARTDELISGD